jgi:hypothetical protein
VTCRPSVRQAACAYSVIESPEPGNSVAAQRGSNAAKPLVRLIGFATFVAERLHSSYERYPGT